MSDSTNLEEFAVELSDGSMRYVGEFDITDFQKGWNQAWEKATEISEEHGLDIDLMNLDLMGNWLQIAHNTFHIHNTLNKKNDAGWFTFEVCMERDDALLVREMLDKHKDSYFLERLLEQYERWDKL